jgi:hypothetical protein
VPGARVHKPAMIRSVARRLGARLHPAVEDQQLVSGHHGLDDHGTESPRPRQSGQDDPMNEYDIEMAHPGNATSKTTALRPIWQFAIDSCICA